MIRVVIALTVFAVSPVWGELSLPTLGKRLTPLSLSCAVHTTQTRVRYRHMQIKHMPEVQPKQLEPRYIYYRLKELRTYGENLDVSKIAEAWASYELNKDPDDPLVPLRKWDDHLYESLNKIFQSQCTRLNTKQFLAAIRKLDFELHEYAEQQIEKNRVRHQRVADSIDPVLLAREWFQYSQTHSDPWPEYHGEGRELSLKIGYILRGRLAEEKVESFLRALVETDLDLYLCFAYQVLAESREDAKRVITDNERWANLWNEIYQKQKRDYFPEEEHHADLRKSVLAYLSYPKKQASSEFRKTLKSFGPFFLTLAKEEQRKLETGVIGLYEPVLSPEVTARRWRWHILGKVFSRPFSAVVSENGSLSAFLLNFFAQDISDPESRAFLKALRPINPLLYHYILEVRDILDTLESKSQTEGLGAYGNIRAAGAAFRWIDYAAYRREPMPPLRHALYDVIYTMRRGAKNPMYTEAFELTLKLNSPRLHEVFLQK